MALTLSNTPGSYFSAHGDLVFVVADVTKASDPVTYVDYKYVCDVYVDSVLVARLKAVPRPDTYFGIFNIGTIVRSYVSATFNPTANALRAQELGSGEFFVTAILRFGEEYGFTMYTNLLTDSARVYYNHYNGQLIGALTNLAALADKAATYRPTITSVPRTADYMFIPYFPTSTANITVTVQTFNSNGLQGTYAQVFAPATANTLQQFNIAPSVINSLSANMIHDGIEYYTVQFGLTSLYRFNLVCEARHTIYALHFLNAAGGFESKHFTKASRNKVSIDREDFGKLPYQISDAGVQTYYNSNNVHHDQRSTYAVTYKETRELNTDFISDDEYVWLADMVLSTMVYFEVSGHFIPVTIDERSYEPKKGINDKLSNLNIKIEYGDTRNAQYR
jgi:hypothetical protein